MLKVVLFGARDTGKLRLGADLQLALARSDWPVTLVLPDAPSLPDIPDQIDLTLLMGLDAAPGTDQAEDQLIRTFLASHGTPYTVLYGSHDECLAQTLTLIEKALVTIGALTSPAPEQGSSPWVWVCDTCSDHECEHRLLTSLLSSKRLTEP